MSTITPNILELLGAFFLGSIVTMVLGWTILGWTIEDHGDDIDDDQQPPTEKHA